MKKKQKKKNKLKLSFFEKSTIAIFSFMLLTFFASIFFVIPSFYYENYDKELYEQYDFHEIRSVTDNTVNFFLYKEELIAFENKEADHLSDVRRLITVLAFLFVISLVTAVSTILFRLYKKREKQLSIFTKYVDSFNLYSLIIFGVISMLSIISFSTFFNYFHYLFFPQGNFIFPADAKIVTFFTFDLFMNGLFRAVFLFFTFNVLARVLLNIKKAFKDL